MFNPKDGNSINSNPAYVASRVDAGRLPLHYGNLRFWESCVRQSSFLPVPLGHIMGGCYGVADINAMVKKLSSTENSKVVFIPSKGKHYSQDDKKGGNAH